MRPLVLALLGLCACNEYSLNEPDPVKPAEPPGEGEQDFGSPPNWQDCFQGWHGSYSNLTADHPHVNPRPWQDPAPTDPDALNWWDDVSYEQFDPTLDFGGNWWPIDEGLAEDPSYFAVHWFAWIRAWSGTDISFTLGSADDAWVRIDGVPVVERPGIHPFEPETIDVHLDAGQYPIEIFFAHRQAESGFRFRVLSGDVSICYPDFAEDGE